MQNESYFVKRMLCRRTGVMWRSWGCVVKRRMCGGGGVMP